MMNAGMLQLKALCDLLGSKSVAIDCGVRVEAVEDWISGRARPFGPALEVLSRYGIPPRAWRRRVTTSKAA